MFKGSLEKENVAILSKAEESKKRTKTSIGLNNFKVILCQSSFNEVEREKSDCNELESEWYPRNER